MPARIIPPILCPGDKIAIVATARKISREEVQPAIGIFKSWGLEPVIDEDLFSVDHQFAGNDHTRAALFRKYLDDDSVKAIISARGGYGTVRMVDEVDFSVLGKKPKWIIGYSDITVLHSHIHQHTNLVSLHAAMPVNMQPHNIDTSSIEALRTALMGNAPMSYQVEADPLNRIGEAKGELVGGNLSVLYSLLGSASDIDTTGKILFIEDLDEYLYHIDRMMQALKRAGKLKNLAGLMVGGMSDMRDNLIPYGHTAAEIIAGTVKEYDYPVCFGFPAGHERINMPLVMGKEVDIRISSAYCHFFANI
ncbi:MAG: LD-carboxypeptidase [Bacteroidota bacterium]